MDFASTPTFTFESLPTEIERQSHIQTTGDSVVREALAGTASVDGTSDITTLCSLAFPLVLKNNPKGYSAADLDLRLRVGYRFGAAPEGCRIDNKILFAVLAEIL
jgi:hypothetical protein